MIFPRAPNTPTVRHITAATNDKRPGRCPLYVRTQLDTAGVTWTKWDLVRPKATARETGKTQPTGYFRRWWQVLDSNQGRLSRRFYRPLPLAARATCLMPPCGTAQ